MAEPARVPIDEEEEHRRLIAAAESLFGSLLDMSSDGVFLYLDDVHKTCNERLAVMFGYSKEEWSETFPYLENFVAPESRTKVMETFRNEIYGNNRPAWFDFVAQRKDGTFFNAQISITPLDFQGQLLTLNLVKAL